MKNILGEWGSHVFVGIVILGLGLTLIYQELSHSADKLKDNVELMDAITFNQQMVEENRKLREQADKLNIRIQQMDNFIGQMYRRLQIYENLPNLPSDRDKPDRSEA